MTSLPPSHWLLLHELLHVTTSCIKYNENTLKLKPCGYQLYTLLVFNPFGDFVGSYWESKRNLGLRLSMLVRIGDRNLVVENIISLICAFTFCIHTHTHTHTHIHIYCIYVHVYDCFYRHKVIVFLSFLFYTLFSLSLFFLHFGIYRMLNIIFATCLSIGQKKNYMTQQDLETF